MSDTLGIAGCTGIEVAFHLGEGQSLPADWHREATV